MNTYLKNAYKLNKELIDKITPEIGSLIKEDYKHDRDFNNKDLREITTLTCILKVKLHMYNKELDLANVINTAIIMLILKQLDEENGNKIKTFKEYLKIVTDLRNVA
jgi:hypothetical protein